MTTRDQTFILEPPLIEEWEWAMSFGRPSATRFRPSDRVPSGLAASRFNRAQLERCEYCQCNRHSCGCEDRFDYEQVRDNPTLLAR